MAALILVTKSAKRYSGWPAESHVINLHCYNIRLSGCYNFYGHNLWSKFCKFMLPQHCVHILWLPETKCNIRIHLLQSFQPAAVWQKIHRYHQTTEQLHSSGCETPELIRRTPSKNVLCSIKWIQLARFSFNPVWQLSHHHQSFSLRLRTATELSVQRGFSSKQDLFNGFLWVLSCIPL